MHYQSWTLPPFLITGSGRLSGARFFGFLAAMMVLAFFALQLFRRHIAQPKLQRKHGLSAD
ncbi:hypothetical protein G7009_05015 [Pseudomonas capeferrum]|uniref:hypothetical protein n=1 Tax=Pseudomonas capeferrum TaxID=1495066 RepID=UPI001C6165F5|nr:hypothetical protein [Pseudomonas capeferrum]MBA1201137.1 hypothetical protein [Pseudomonas capeferrum]